MPVFHYNREFSDAEHNARKRLHLGDRNASNSDIRIIVNILKGTQIHELYLNNNRVKDGGVKCLVNFLKKTHIDLVDLSNNCIYDQGAFHLAQNLKDTKVITLNLDGNSIGDEGFKYLAEALKETQIAQLLLCKNAITTEGIRHLSNVLDNSKLNYLHLDVRTEKQFKPILIKLDESEISITLNDNKIGPRGAECISEVFKKISVLILKEQVLEDDVQYLDRAFKDIEIKSLEVHKECFKDTSCLIKAFKNGYISQLHIHWCCADLSKIKRENFEFTDVQNIIQFIKEANIIDLRANWTKYAIYFLENFPSVLKKTAILKLTVDGNILRPDELQHFVAVLKHTLITHLDLSCNYIEDEGVKLLADNLKDTELVSINVERNEITQEGYQYMMDAIADSNVCRINFGSVYFKTEKKEITKVWTRDFSTTPAYKVCETFNRLVSLNPLSEEFEFSVPEEPSEPTFRFDDYVFLIKTLTSRPNVRAHIFNDLCFTDSGIFKADIMHKINRFVFSVSDMFNTFFNNFISMFSDSNYVDVVKSFEDADLSDVVQNFLLHRELFYVDEKGELLNPYIYRLLHKYRMPLFNELLEPTKKDVILSFYKTHLEIEGAQELLDVLN